MPISCQFNFKRVTPIFYNGERISGGISLAVVGRKPAQLEAIKITLLGKGTCAWSEVTATPTIEHNDSCANNNRTLVNYDGVQEFVRQTVTLQSVPLQLKSDNRYAFDFNFELPTRLPATCKLPNGEIGYALQVSLERKTKHVKVFEQRLIIKNRIELQALAQYCMKSVANDRLEFSTTRCVYVPGQRVDYRLQLGKQSCAYPMKYAVRLCQSVLCRSTQPLAKTKRFVRVLDSQQQRTHGTLHLPLTTPIMTVYGGDFIHITYYLEAISHVASSSSSTACEQLVLPLYIGTVLPQMRASTAADIQLSLTLNTKNANNNDEHDIERNNDEYCCFVNMANTITLSEYDGDSLGSTCPLSVWFAENSCIEGENNETNFCDRNKLLQLERQSHIKTVLNYLY